MSVGAGCHIQVARIITLYESQLLVPDTGWVTTPSHHHPIRGLNPGFVTNHRPVSGEMSVHHGKPRGIRQTFILWRVFMHNERGLDIYKPI